VGGKKEKNVETEREVEKLPQVRNGPVHNECRMLNHSGWADMGVLVTRKRELLELR
jgi:hypothetical protein